MKKNPKDLHRNISKNLNGYSSNTLFDAWKEWQRVRHCDIPIVRQPKVSSNSNHEKLLRDISLVGRINLSKY